ncbi:excalibur calcium-binding domain-containing protein [Exiguobacterium profundum]
MTKDRDKDGIACER